MKKLKYAAIKAAIACMKLLYAPMKALPVQKKVVMISRQSDHPSLDMRLLRERLLAEHPDYKVPILAKKLKKPVSYLFHILSQMYHIATARAVVLDSYCIPISVLNHRDSLIVIQMWHSMGSMKKFGYAMLNMEEGSDPELARVMRMHRNYTYILISSFSYLKDYIEGFRTTADKVRQIPQPRADLLVDREYMARVRRELVEKMPALGAKKNILYCPTFRKQFSGEDLEKVRELADAVDYSRYNLIYKPHSVSEMELTDPRIITAELNQVEAMAVADYVISDYSSIIYEAGLCRLPVFLYMYDWDHYSEKRALNVDYDTEVPLLKSGEPGPILAAIEAEPTVDQAFLDFVDKNVVMPETSCCEEIIRLMQL